MEFASRLRWFILVMIVIILLILVGWAMFGIAKSLFTGSSDRGAIVSQEELYSVQSTGTATLIVDGPIVANADHKTYEIAVSERVVTMKVYSEYGDKLIKEVAYKNTSSSYDNFLSALDHLGVTDRQKNTDEDDDYDEQGRCHNGNRYIVELDNEIRRWNTSCSTKLGTAGFDMSSVRGLFEDQIPEFREVIRGSNL